MKRLTLFRLTVATAIACFSWIPSFAQSEKITIGMVPVPNQTVRMRMIQEMETEMSFEGDVPPPVPGVGPMRLATKTVVLMTQRTGAADAKGNIQSEMTYDEISSAATMNGLPMPGNDTSSKLIGKKLMVTFDKQGNVTNIEAPADSGLPEDQLREMLKSFYGNLPSVSIGVGEVATSPLDFTVPLPIPGTGPIKMDGAVQYKLISIEKDATGRIARFDQTVDGKMVNDMEVAVTSGTAKMSFDFKINGDGTMLKDLDRGLIRSSEARATLVGKIKLSGGPSATQLPPMNLQGTMKTTLTSSN